MRFRNLITRSTLFCVTLLAASAALSQGVSPFAPQPYVLNAQALNGLQAYKDQLAAPGVDVLFIGDSLMNVVSVLDGVEPRNYYTMIAHARRDLQKRLNRPGVGGIGYLAMAGGSPTFRRNQEPIWTLQPLNLSLGDTYNFIGKGPGSRDLGLASGTNRYFGAWMNATHPDAEYRRLRVTDFAVVFRSELLGNQLRLDVSQKVWPAPGGGRDLSTTVSTQSFHPYTGARSKLFSIPNPNGDNRIVVRGAATGPVTFVDGYMLFNGDAHEGIRVHDLTNSGASAPLNWADANLFATVDQFSLHSKAPATNARVAVLSMLVNEAGSYPSRTVADMAHHIRRVVTYCRNRGLKVILLVPPRINPSAFWSPLVYDGAFLPLRTQIINMMFEFPDDVTVVWASGFNQDRPYGAGDPTPGLFLPDGVHYDHPAHKWMGEAISHLIVNGFNGQN